MGRDDSIHIRVSPAEKAAFFSAAEDAGMPVSEFMRRAAKSVDPKRLRQGPEPALPKIEVFRPSRRKSRPLEDIPPFRMPFLHGVQGFGFERAVCFAARQMQIDQHTMALALTYFGEAMAHAIKSGQVFRWPGLFDAGPYLARSKMDDREHVWPRFQANPPLSRDVDENCPPFYAKNEELDAHRRRSRRKGVQGVREVMETVRQAIVNQDVRAQRIVEDYWRDESIEHAI